MNYKELVDRIRQVVFDHKMLVDFGYGQISDIKTRSEGEGELQGADYPYCFLNPSQHIRTQTEITYQFNMILMDMAREEEGDEYQNFLAIQSDCMQYIDDIIARLYYHYKDQPEVSFDLNYTPFYERFQDSLAGATANLSITVPTNINDCITPFVVEPTLIETITRASGEGVDYHETILSFGPRNVPVARYFVVYEGSVTNQQLLPENPGRVQFKSGTNLDPSIHEIDIVSDNGATNQWTYTSPIFLINSNSFNFAMNFGDAPSPDIAPGGITNGVQSIKFYRVND